MGTTEYVPNLNCQQRSRPDARSRPPPGSWGLGREAWAAYSVLRVRTGTECPEDNLRELT